VYVLVNDIQVGTSDANRYRLSVFTARGIGVNLLMKPLLSLDLWVLFGVLDFL